MEMFAFFAESSGNRDMGKKYVDQEWDRLDVEITRSGRSIWSKGHVLQPEWFLNAVCDFTIWFFFQGKGSLIDHSGKTHELNAGTCLCMVPGVQYTAIQGDEEQMLGDAFIHANFYYDGRGPIPKSQWPEMPAMLEVININFYDQITRRIVEITSRLVRSGRLIKPEQKREASYLFKSMLINLQQYHEEQKSRRKRGISLHHEKKVTETLAALYEDPLRFRSVEEMAHFCGYSTSHFRSICQAVAGSNPSDIIIQTRIERAKAMLRYSDTSISMIAEALGYESVFYFSRQFRSVTGQTATQYRDISQ